MNKANKEPLPIIFFAHSAGAQYGQGKGSYDLVQYLRAQLAGQFRIAYPKIPRPNTPTYAKYKTMFAAHLEDLHAPVILVGHSLGASTLVKYLAEEKPGITIASLHLVATPFWKSNMKEFQLPAQFGRSLSHIPSIHLYQSRNDEEIPAEHLEIYKAALPQATVHLVPGKEHTFNKGLPVLIKMIRAGR